MPVYLYSNPENEAEVVEIVQSINDDHVYSRGGVKWNRVFTVPTSSVDTKWDADDPKSFVEKTGNKRGTLGEIQDKAKELSLQREKRDGVDHVKEQFYKDYSNARAGKEHPDVKKRKMKKKLSKTNFEWSD